MIKIKWEKIMVASSFLGLFLLYLYTLAPSVPTGDSGELIASAYTLGIPHAPGYPLFNLIGKAFSFIPFGNVAWRINLMSAIFSLLASFFIYLTLVRLTKYWPAAIFGMLFFALSPIVWEYSLKAEVFALNNFFASLIIYLVVVLRDCYPSERNDSAFLNTTHTILYLLFFTCGLALTNHHTIILFAPGVILALLLYARLILFKPTTLFIALGAFVLGLAVYLYIPIRAHAQPYMNWDDVRSWHGFIQLITRADAGTFNLMIVDNEAYSFIERCSLYLYSFIKEFNLFGIILILLGLFSLIRQKDKKLCMILLLLYFLSSFGFLLIANLAKNNAILIGVFERFYMLSAVLVALFIGMGVYFLQSIISNKRITYWLNGGILISILIMTCFNLPRTSQRDNYLDYNLGWNVLNSLEKEAVVVVYGDTLTFSLNYLQQVEGLRPDVIVLNQLLLTHSWYCRQMQARYPTLKLPYEKYDDSNKIIDLIAANINQHLFYMELNTNDFINTPYQFIAKGLVSQIVTKNSRPTAKIYIKENKIIWNNYNLTGLTSFYSPLSFEKEIIRKYAIAHFNLGSNYAQMKLFDLALTEYNTAIQIEPSLYYAYKNAGLLYVNVKHQPNKAIPYLKAYLRLNPTDPENAAILAFIQK